MKCPGPIRILEDWVRRRRGEPRRYTDHALDCAACTQVFDGMNAAEERLRPLDLSASEGHLTPEQQAAYVERKLSQMERGQAIQHIADCSDCREAVVALSELVGAPILSRAG